MSGPEPLTEVRNPRLIFPMKTTVQVLLTVATLSATSLVTSAQQPAPPTPPNGQGGGERRDRGNFEDFRKRMNERLKESLKVSDEEWGVIQPLIEKVGEKQREAMGGRFGGGPGGSRGPGGDRGPGGNGPGNNAPAPDLSRPGAAESQALRTALENESTSADELKAKLNALREVRKKGAAELVVAREELRKVVTVRQEAVLVSMGILE